MMTNQSIKKLEVMDDDKRSSPSNEVNLQSITNLAIKPQLGCYIILPKQIALKKACINVKNADDASFAWAVTSALHPAYKNADRVTSYRHYSNVLKLDDIQFPVTFKQIPKFEQLNNISINVYILEGNEKLEVIPAYLTDNNCQIHINLLLLTQNDCNTIKCHYIWIKNLSRLLSAQLSKHNGQLFFCDSCLNYFRCKNKCDEHITKCKKLILRNSSLKYSSLHKFRRNREFHNL